MAGFKYEFLEPQEHLRIVEDGLRRLEARHAQTVTNRRVSLGTDGRDSEVDQIEAEIIALREERDKAQEAVKKARSTST